MSRKPAQYILLTSEVIRKSCMLIGADFLARVYMGQTDRIRVLEVGRHGDLHSAGRYTGLRIVYIRASSQDTAGNQKEHP